MKFIYVFLGFLLFFSLVDALPRPPSGASVLDIDIRNISLSVDNQFIRFTGLQFKAHGGGGFSIYPSLRNYTRFYVVLANLTNNAGAYKGHLIYYNGTRWTSAGRYFGVGAVPSDYPWNFVHYVPYITANRTLARPSRVNISIAGNFTSAPYGAIDVVDVRDPHQNFWSISFAYPYRIITSVINRTGFGQYHGSDRRISYQFRDESGFSTFYARRGFKSPAEVNLTDLEAYAVRFVEWSNSLATSFSFTCVDPDGLGRYTGSSVNLTYPSGSFEISRDRCTPISSGARLDEGACISSSLPYGAFGTTEILCSTCNAAGTACAS